MTISISLTPLEGSPKKTTALELDYRAAAIARARSVMPLIDRLLRPEAEVRQMQQARVDGISESRLAALYPFSHADYGPCGEAALHVSLENPWLGEQLWRIAPADRVRLLPPSAQEYLRSRLPITESKPRNQFATVLEILFALARYDFERGEREGVWAPTGFNWLLLETRARQLVELLEELERRWEEHNVRPSDSDAAPGLGSPARTARDEPISSS